MQIKSTQFNLKNQNLKTGTENKANEASSVNTEAAAPQGPEYDLPKDHFGYGIPNYTGPADGLSREPKMKPLLGFLNKAMIAGCYRMEVEGKENFIEEGPQIYCPTHPSMFDPPLIAALSNRDMRYPANIYVFDGMRGPIMTMGGGFPLHRDNPRMKTKRHMIDIIKQGKGFVIFPEGGVASEQEFGQVGPLKKGAAKLAIMGEAENIIPIAIEYRDDNKERKGEAIAGGLAAAAVGVAGVLSAFGGPVTRAIGGALTGAVTGAYVGGKVNRNITSNPEWFDQFPKYYATMNGGLLGGAIGAIAGGIAGTFLPDGASQLTTAALGVGAGTSTLAIAEGLRTRPVAHLKIGKPLEVAPYKEEHKTLQKAGDALTLDLHKALSAEKNALNGVEQLEPAFREHVEETLKLAPGEVAPPPPIAGPNKLKATFKYGSSPVVHGGIGTLVGMGVSAALGMDPALGTAAGLVVGVTTGALSTINKAVKAGAELPPELR